MNENKRPIYRQLVVEIYVQDKDNTSDISKPVNVEMAWNTKIPIQKVAELVAHYIEYGDYGDYKEGEFK
jgi:hypothetical protein